MAQSWKEVRFAVWNPAIGDVDELIPTQSHSYSQPRAVQLSVDHETKHYTVLVAVTYRDSEDQDVASATLYHSARTQFWSYFMDSSKIVLGCSYSCMRGYFDGPTIPNGSWISSTAKGRERDYEGELVHHVHGAPLTSGRTKVTLISSAVTNSRGFHLQKVEGMQGYRIWEFYYDARVLKSVKLHSCSPLDKFSEAEYTLKLHSCRGFLMVSAFPKSSSRFYRQRHWFCALSNGEWRELPALAADIAFNADDILCELQRSIIPKGARVPSSDRGPWIFNTESEAEEDAEKDSEEESDWW